MCYITMLQFICSLCNILVISQFTSLINLLLLMSNLPQLASFFSCHRGPFLCEIQCNGTEVLKPFLEKTLEQIMLK